MSRLFLTESVKKRICGKQYYKCANKPGLNLTGLELYICPLWNQNGDNKGSFDESGYNIDHIEEFSINQNNDESNLQALCIMCHAVKTKRFLSNSMSKSTKILIKNNTNHEFVKNTIKINIKDMKHKVTHAEEPLLDIYFDILKASHLRWLMGFLGIPYSGDMRYKKNLRDGLLKGMTSERVKKMNKLIQENRNKKYLIGHISYSTNRNCPLYWICGTYHDLLELPPYVCQICKKDGVYFSSYNPFCIYNTPNINTVGNIKYIRNEDLPLEKLQLVCEDLTIEYHNNTKIQLIEKLLNSGKYANYVDHMFHIYNMHSNKDLIDMFGLGTRKELINKAVNEEIKGLIY